MYCVQGVFTQDRKLDVLSMDRESQSGSPFSMFLLGLSQNFSGVLFNLEECVFLCRLHLKPTGGNGLLSSFSLAPAQG